MPLFSKTRSVRGIEILCVWKGTKVLNFISVSEFLFLINALFKNSETLIKLKTLAPFHTQ
jgi:hypothetical protein